VIAHKYKKRFASTMPTLFFYIRHYLSPEAALIEALPELNPALICLRVYGIPSYVISLQSERSK
jgi:hypothetical protein